jgi:hypothetical protein
MRLIPLLILGLASAACSGERSGAPCGLAATIGPSSLLSQFGVPRQTLSEPPERLPERLAARMAGGPAFSAVVGRERAGDSLLVVGVEGTAPEAFTLGFGVLVMEPNGNARGIMLFQGLPVENAPRLGTVTMGAVSAPLIGVEADPTSYEQAECPFFPDSLAR